MKEIEDLIEAEKVLNYKIIDLITESKEKIDLLIKISFYRESISKYDGSGTLYLKEPFNGYCGYYEELFDADISFDSDRKVLCSANYNLFDIIFSFESPLGGEENPYGDIETVDLKLSIEEINSSVKELKLKLEELNEKIKSIRLKNEKSSEKSKLLKLKMLANELGYNLEKNKWYKNQLIKLNNQN